MLQWAKDKFLSRKFLTVVAAVAAAAVGLVPWTDVITLATAWIAGQSLVDAVSAAKKIPEAEKGSK